MTSMTNFNLWIMLLLIGQVSAVSYNQPKFCPNASWNPNATTVANNNTIGLYPYDIFINTDNTLYVVNQQDNLIFVWSEGSIISTSIYGSFSMPYSLFVTTSGDIYVDSDNSTGRVDTCTLNSTTSASVMYTCGKCYDLFVDISDTLYCSMINYPQVVTKSLNSASNALKIVAGTGTAGNTSYMLNNPYGIFVDTNFHLYVADCANDRIQLFQSSQSAATTIAGIGSSVAFSLDHPTAIVLDTDRNFYIVDRWNHRIVASGPNGFRCIVACYHSTDLPSDELWYSWSLSFDSYGNMFVDDQQNSRIQMFTLLTNLCDEIMTTAETITSTVLVECTTNTIELNAVTISSSNKIVSYNQPHLDAYASWDTNAITFAINSTIGSFPYGIFIDTNNTIYIADQDTGKIQVWFNNSMTPTRTISGNLSHPFTLFVTITGDIYDDNGFLNHRVDKWTEDANTSVPVMYVAGKCLGLFVDINDILYCSMSDFHQVVTKSLNSNSNTTTIVAGTSCSGSTPNTLSSPYGIFVDINLDLYVADYGNDRIQLFRSDELNGITVAGNESLNITITLNQPTGVVLDANKYIFIVDNSNNRIVGSGPNGFQCLVGCSNIAGGGSDQLNYPYSLSFDSFGNIFVTDQLNSRIQKFLLNKSDDEYTTHESTMMSTSEKVESSSVSIESTTLSSTAESLQLSVSPSCLGQYQISLSCNISFTPCDLLQPCENNDNCMNNNNTIPGYNCLCAPSFNGTDCQIDNRPCKSNTCWNNGICNETSHKTSKCLCQPGWTDMHCQTMINIVKIFNV